MNIWNPYPFFRLIIPFVLGILTAIYTRLPSFAGKEKLLVISLILLLLAFGAHFIRRYSWRWLPGFLMYLFALVAGYTLTVCQTAAFRESHFSQFNYKRHSMVVRILEPPVNKPASSRSVIGVMMLQDSAVAKHVSGKVLVYFEKSKKSDSLNYGDVIIMEPVPEPVAPPPNPHQFDYRQYLSNQNIYHLAYLKDEQWVKIDSNRVNPLFALAHRARSQMLNMLQENGLSGDELAVVSAVLLGYDEYMEPELRNRYAGAGAMHVLCVSGLHVGIIFFILNFLLKSFDRRKETRMLKMLLLLLSIWAYAFITGLSPSVMRAGVMFSLFAWREVRREKSNPYNILAASAFVLLLADPFMITKIGFQLSYAAVLAILALFKPIYGLLAVKYPIADYAWKLTAVSLSAQIGTFPLAIYYFNQFPAYFFITNLVAIPLVWVIVNLGILALAASFLWKVLALKLSMLIYLLTYVLNQAVAFIHAIPGSQFDGLAIDITQVILIYGGIVFLARSLLGGSTRLLLASAVAVVALFFSFGLNRLEHLRQEKIVVYQITGHSAIDLISGQTAIAIADSALFQEPGAVEFYINDNRIYSGIRNIIPASFRNYSLEALNQSGQPFRYFHAHFFQFANQQIAVVGKSFPKYDPVKPLKVDLVILRDNPKISPEKILALFDFNVCIADASNSYWAADRFEKYFTNQELQFYNVRTQGAFILQWQKPLNEIFRFSSRRSRFSGVGDSRYKF